MNWVHLEALGMEGGINVVQNMDCETEAFLVSFLLKKMWRIVSCVCFLGYGMSSQLLLLDGRSLVCRG